MGQYVLCNSRGDAVGAGYEVCAMRHAQPQYVDSWSPDTREVWLRDTAVSEPGQLRTIVATTLSHYGLKFIWKENG